MLSAAVDRMVVHTTSFELELICHISLRLVAEETEDCTSNDSILRSSSYGSWLSTARKSIHVSTAKRVRGAEQKCRARAPTEVGYGRHNSARRRIVPSDRATSTCSANLAKQSISSAPCGKCIRRQNQQLGRGPWTGMVLPMQQLGHFER